MLRLGVHVIEGRWLAMCRPVSICCCASGLRLEASRVHAGSRSIFGTCSSASSQLARLATNMWAVGLSVTSLFRLPAGTTTSAPFICNVGSPEPQTAQKLRLCRVEGRSNRVTLSAPESHRSVAEGANRLAACAEPVSLRQCSQWHRKKLANGPSTSKRTSPHRHDPECVLLIAILYTSQPSRQRITGFAWRCSRVLRLTCVG